MEIKPELKRALKHYETFIKIVVRNKDHLDVYLASTKTWSEEEMLFMRDHWDLDHNVDHSEEPSYMGIAEVDCCQDCDNCSDEGCEDCECEEDDECEDCDCEYCECEKD